MKSNRIRNLFICIALSAALVVSGSVFAFGDSGGSGNSGDSGVRVERLFAEQQAISEMTTKPVKGAEYDGYLVKIDDDAVGSINATAMKNVSECVVGNDIALVDDPQDALKFADADDIEIIEPNYIYKEFSLSTVVPIDYRAFEFPWTDPVDPLYANAANYQWGIRYVGANAAWLAGYRGQGVNIAIMDSGIVKGHEDLSANKIVREYDWIHGRYDATDDDMHGSVVSSIIAADTNNFQLGTMNGVGMAGITDQAGLVIHKVLDAQGNGGVGILYALNDILQDGTRIDVMNMSLGGEGKLDIMDDMLQKIMKKGTIVVAATGNNGINTDGSANRMNYPAGYANVIGVGSIGQSGVVSDFSAKNGSCDVVAPGEYMVGAQFNSTSGYYVQYFGPYPLHGTSFACPIVAAAAAIAKQRDKNIDSGAFLTALKRTARDAGPAGYDTSYGNGILDINRLVEYLQNGSVKITFKANSGKVGTKSKMVWPGGKYGKLPTAKRSKKIKKSKKVFAGWYTKKKGGARITSLSKVGNAKTLYAHWQPGNTLSGLATSKGKLRPAFSYKKKSYKLTLSKNKASVKITPKKSYKSAKMRIKVGSGKYKAKKSVTVKLKKGKRVTVSVKIKVKGQKAKIYKIKVRRKK
jgi:subtilisin family serine protease